MADPKWDDTEEIDEVPKFEDTEDIVEDKPYEMGAGEAALTGLGEGATLGLGPILAGIAGAGGEVVEDIGDILGLTDDAELREQGFEVEDPEKGLQGLLDAYYKSRDIARQQQAKAFEDQPAATIGGGIIGSLATMQPVAQGAKALAGTGRAGEVAATILPKIDDLKKASVIQKMGVAAREGAKAGALTGFGSGEGKLLEGEVGKTAKDVILTSAGGSLVGAGLSGAGSALGGIAKRIPGVKSFTLGRKIAEEGLDLDERAIKSEIKKFSEDLRSIVQDVFRKNKVAKGSAIDYADEMGIRVTEAGETIDDVIDDLIKKGASSEVDQAEKVKLLNALNELKGEKPKLRKMQESFDKVRAKMAAKLERSGGEIKRSTDFEGDFDELLPLPDSKGKVYGVEDKIVLPNGEVVYKSTVQSQIDDVIPIKKYDLDDMSLSQMEDLISEVNRHTGDVSSKAKSPVEQVARNLAKNLRSLSNAAFERGPVTKEGQSLASSNIKMHEIFTALKKGNVKGDVLTNRPVIRDEQVDAIRKLVLGSGDASEINRERFFEYLQKASKEFDAPADRAQFLNDALKLAKNLDVDRTVSLKGLVGSAQGIVAKAGSFVGKISKGLRDASSKTSEHLRDSAKVMVEITPDEINELISTLYAKYEGKVSPFIGPLKQAAATPNNSSKQAIMYGLYQQPAFRQTLRQLGGEVFMQDDDSLEESEAPKTLESSSYENTMKRWNETKAGVKNVGRSPSGIRELEGTRLVGYVPSDSSGVTIASGLDLAAFKDWDKLQLPKEIQDKLTPFMGLVGGEAKEVAKKLVLSQEEVDTIDSAYDRYLKNTLVSRDMEVSEDFNKAMGSLQTNNASAAIKFKKRYESGHLDEAKRGVIQTNKSGDEFMPGLLVRRAAELMVMFPQDKEEIEKRAEDEFHRRLQEGHTAAKDWKYYKRLIPEQIQKIKS